MTASGVLVYMQASSQLRLSRHRAVVSAASTAGAELPCVGKEMTDSDALMRLMSRNSLLKVALV